MENNSVEEFATADDSSEIEEKSQEDGDNSDNQTEPTLLNKIKNLLSSKQMKSSKIATELGVSKKKSTKFYTPIVMLLLKISSSTGD